MLLFCASLLRPVYAENQAGALKKETPQKADQIKTDELFHDQGELFCSSSEPSSHEDVSILFRSAKDDLSGVILKYLDSRDKSYHLLEMKKLTLAAASDRAATRYDFWQAKIPAGQSTKRYRFNLSKNSSESERKKIEAWYSAAGPSLSESQASDFFLIPDFHTPDWLKNGVMYQIFPDRFFDGDPGNNVKTGDYEYAGIKTVQKRWGESPIPEKGENPAFIFYGGDLAGIKARLSYLRETLGVNIIYLNPVFESPSNHKYDTCDFERVAECLGSNRSLWELSTALHRKHKGKSGYLILDAVFNHTGDGHYWFAKYNFKNSHNEKGAYQSKESPYFSYYSFSKWPDKYATFLNVESLPKLNYGSEELRKLFYKNPDSIALRYLKEPYKIDGWRVDAPQYIDRDGKQGLSELNHQIWREYRTAIKSVNPEACILGEFWQDASPWLKGKEWDSVTNFNGFTQPLTQFICGKNYDGKPAPLTPSEFNRYLAHTRALYPSCVQHCLSNHLSNHDIARFAQNAGGDSRKIALAQLFQMTYPGLPTIYYGDEYGMMGGRDPDDRRCFDWSELEKKNQLIENCAQLIKIRNSYSSLRTGSYLSLLSNDVDAVYAFARMDKKSRIAVVMNAGSKDSNARIPVYKLEIPGQCRLKDALSGQLHSVEDGYLSLQLKPFSGKILIFEAERP